MHENESMIDVCCKQYLFGRLCWTWRMSDCLGVDAVVVVHSLNIARLGIVGEHVCRHILDRHSSYALRQRNGERVVLGRPVIKLNNKNRQTVNPKH